MAEPENSDNITPAEIIHPSALHALESAHIDVQVRTAHTYPRNLEKFRKRALDMVHTDEETAESCIYCRPVGKVQDERGRWVEKYAEGPSIRMAEIVSACYGNIRIAARVIEQTERYVKCEGVCHDLETNTAGKSECVEATVDKLGRPYSERQRALMAKVCLSKAYRDATFRIVPRALCKTVFDAAKRVISAADKPLAERVKRAQAWIAQIKVPEDRVFAALGVKGWQEINADHIVILMGLKTAISEGDEKIDEVFPILAKTAEDPKRTTPPQQQPPQQQPPRQKGEKGETKAPEKAAEAKPAAAASSDKPRCKYCKAEVDDMAKHECEQMKAALKEKTEPKPEPEKAPAEPVPEKGQAEKPAEPAQQQTSADIESTPQGANDALKSIELLLKQNNINRHQLMVFCVRNKLAKEGQKLEELATSKLERINSKFFNMLDELRKIEPF